MDRSHVDARPHETAPWFVTVCRGRTFVCLVGNGSSPHVLVNMLTFSRSRIIRSLNERIVYLGITRQFVVGFLLLAMRFQYEWMDKAHYRFRDYCLSLVWYTHRVSSLPAIPILVHTFILTAKPIGKQKIHRIMWGFVLTKRKNRNYSSNIWVHRLSTKCPSLSWQSPKPYHTSSITHLSLSSSVSIIWRHKENHEWQASPIVQRCYVITGVWQSSTSSALATWSKIYHTIIN